MERLTIQDLMDHCERQMARTQNSSMVYREHDAILACLHELVSYRDTGLEPDEIAILRGVYERSRMAKVMQWEEAEREGCLVVLPCKVGDTAYFRTYAKNGTVDLGIQPHEVVDIRTHVIVKGEHTDVGLPITNLGRVWFLSPKEAEKRWGEHGR